MRNPFRSFLAAAGVSFSALLILVAGVNYHYDPANLFGDRTYEGGVASLLAAGKNVANINDYDERLVQKFFVERLEQGRQVLVLGSSRSMNIGPRSFPGMTFYNASVSGASLEDYYAVFQLYRERRLLPKILVLGVDPWVFNRNSSQTRWKSLEAEYKRALLEDGVGDVHALSDKEQWRRLQQLFSYDYFRAALRSGQRTDRDYFATSATELDVNIRLADGTISYKTDYAHRSAEQVAAIALQQAGKDPIYSLGNFRELDPEYVILLDSLLSRLHHENVGVVLFLAPYQPDMYAAITRDGSPYRLVQEVEKFLHKVADRHGLELLGSYNPGLTPCGRSDFYDEMHPSSACVAKIFGMGQQ